MTTLPYGSWPSPITAALLVEQAVGLGDLTVDGSDLLWAELRPSESGRQVVVRDRPGSAPTDLFPAPFSARSSVHEYGGAPYCVRGGTCWFVNFADQRIPGASPMAERLSLSRLKANLLDRSGTQNLVLDAGGATIYAVRERHGVDGLEGALGVINDIVAIATDGSTITLVAGGHDFYSAPRLDPDGSRLVFVAWDHPNMPWDGTTLYSLALAEGAEPAVIAGGVGEAVSQPRFAPNGSLHYLSDYSGFTSLYREDHSAVVEIGTDLSSPDWVFGQSSYVLLADGSVVVAVETERGSALTHFVDGVGTTIGGRFDSASSLHFVDDHIAALVGSATEPVSVALLPIDGGEPEIIRTSRAVPVDAGYLSVPKSVTIPTARGDVHALFYPPMNRDADGPEGEQPPLVVISHGGPTSRTSALFNLRLQFFTSRGVAVADVNYGGSSGFGRAYRQRLNGNWGIVDVEDCAAVALALAGQGRVDPARLAIRGGSAGGYTTLCALVFTDTFAVGASYYGVSDLIVLAEDTHKFEARYLDGLVGPLPESRAIYDARSPLAHATSITCPVIFFQGLDDFVVPPKQAEVLVRALTDGGIPVAYLALEGEGHGFRKAESTIVVTEAELGFFGVVLGFTPADALDPIPIANQSALAT